MALKDKLFTLIDNAGLSEVFNRKQPDTKTLRAPLLKGIAKAQRQFEAGQTRVPNRWWKVGNGVVALTVKVGGNTFEVNGVATNHIPEDRFAEFLDAFRGAVDVGEFDDELAHKGEGDAKGVIPKSGRRGSISPEVAEARGIKAAESRARNRATRAAEAGTTEPEDTSIEPAADVPARPGRGRRSKAQPVA